MILFVRFWMRGCLYQKRILGRKSEMRGRRLEEQFVLLKVCRHFPVYIMLKTVFSKYPELWKVW